MNKQKIWRICPMGILAALLFPLNSWSSDSDCLRIILNSNTANVVYEIEALESEVGLEQAQKIGAALQEVDALLGSFATPERVGVKFFKSLDESLYDRQFHSFPDGTLYLAYEAGAKSFQPGIFLKIAIQHERSHQYFAYNIRVGDSSLNDLLKKANADLTKETIDSDVVYADTQNLRNEARQALDSGNVQLAERLWNQYLALMDQAEEKYQAAVVNRERLSHPLIRSLNELWADLIPTLLSPNKDAVFEEIRAILPETISDREVTFIKQRAFQKWQDGIRYAKLDDVMSGKDVYTSLAAFRGHLGTYYLSNPKFSARTIASNFIKVAQVEISKLVSALDSGANPDLGFEVVNRRLIEAFDNLMGTQFPIHVSLKEERLIP